MDDKISGHFQDGTSPDDNIIAIKYFFFESNARLYAARLKDEGIPSFVSNAHSITTFL